MSLAHNYLPGCEVYGEWPHVMSPTSTRVLVEHLTPPDQGKYQPGAQLSTTRQ